MSYSYQVKKSLIAEKKHFCCQKAELYGFLCFCNTFTQQKIRIVLEHKSILDYFIAQIQKICQIRLSEEEIRMLENLGDEAQLPVIRYWEKEMK